MMAQREGGDVDLHVERFDGRRALPEPPKQHISPVVLIIITALVSALVGLGVAGLTRLAETSVAHDGTLREMQAERRAIADRLNELLAEVRRITERMETVRDEQVQIEGRVTRLEALGDNHARRLESMETKGPRK
jgi:predicted nuclease with TOPRIM domain